MTSLSSSTESCRAGMWSQVSQAPSQCLTASEHDWHTWGLKPRLRAHTTKYPEGPKNFLCLTVKEAEFFKGRCLSSDLPQKLGARTGIDVHSWLPFLKPLSDAPQEPLLLHTKGSPNCSFTFGSSNSWKYSAIYQAAWPPKRLLLSKSRKALLWLQSSPEFC